MKSAKFSYKKLTVKHCTGRARYTAHVLPSFPRKIQSPEPCLRCSMYHPGLLEYDFVYFLLKWDCERPRDLARAVTSAELAQTSPAPVQHFPHSVHSNLLPSTKGMRASIWGLVEFVRGSSRRGGAGLKVGERANALFMACLSTVEKNTSMCAGAKMLLYGQFLTI